MEYTIRNEELEVRIATRGAELQSIRKSDGTEYLWQGDPAIWRSRATNLFPYIGRLTEGTFTFEGQAYQMRHHGFLCERELAVKEQEAERIVFSLIADEETHKCYPFLFEYQIEYQLKDNQIQITMRVINTDNKAIYFGIGGHPGFNIPMNGDGNFEDYYLEFEEGISPERIGISETGFVNGVCEPYCLRDGKYIDLRHDLFDSDAIVLKEMGTKVAIRSKCSERAVLVEYPQMSYVGIWHAMKVAAEYVCIEPWSSLPSREGIIEDIAAQENIVCTNVGEIYENSWSITII